MNKDYFWYATYNPDYPGKGHRPWCVMIRYPNGTEARLDQQFNKQHTASRYATKIQIDYDRRQNRQRHVYLGD